MVSDNIDKFLTRELFEKHLEKIIDYVKENGECIYSDAYYVLGYLILRIGAIFPDKCKRKILNKIDYEINEFEGWDNPECRLLYLKDFKEKIMNHKVGQKTNLVYFGEDEERSFNDVCVGLIQLQEALKLGIINNICELYLDSYHIKTIPDFIFEIESLEILSLSDNQLKILPEAMGNLKSLKELNLNDNLLEFIPNSIGEISSLEKLLLKHNPLQELPESIGKLEKLNKLSLNKNLLEEFYSSNLKQWAKNDFNPNILYKNYPLPLLKTLIEKGNLTAKRFLKDKFIEWIPESDYSEINHWESDGYFELFSDEEIAKIFNEFDFKIISQEKYRKSFPLLNTFASKIPSVIALFKEEIKNLFKNGYLVDKKYVIRNDYLKYFDGEEIIELFHDFDFNSLLKGKENKLLLKKLVKLKVPKVKDYLKS